MPEVIEEVTSTQVDARQNRDHPSKEIREAPGSLDSIHFRLPVFEGPLDLLLHLIKEQKIDIYDIPIVDITHQYLAYIDIMKDLNLEIAGEFLVMAATLIHIKSKMLLPPAEVEQEEPAEDPRADLVKRLLEYQSYKESTSHLRKREEIWKNIFYRSQTDENAIEFEPEPLLVEASVFDLITAFRKLLEKAPEQVIEITRETLTVADKINYIVDRLEKEDGIRFEDLFKDGIIKITLVVTFLALLELVRLGLARLYQEKIFGIIWIINPDLPQKDSSGEKEQEIRS